jgi:hypothetical protein
MHNEFEDEEIQVEEIDVIKFRASYKNTWQDANCPLSQKDTFEFQGNYDTQSAIRRLNGDKVPELILKLAGTPFLPVPDSTNPFDLIVGGHKIQLSRRRVGQQEFRLSLIHNNGENCFISGAQPACVLEASHIRSFAEHESHSIDGGLLLRRDFHTLFDRQLIRINADNWVVETAPKIREYPTYGAIHERKLHQLSAAKPNQAWLRDHYVSAESIFNA